MNWIQNLGASIFRLHDHIGTDISSDQWMTFDPEFDFGDFSTDALKIAAVFCNPAVLKVFKLQCDMFSLGKVYVYRNGKELPNDPFLSLIENPNPFQQQNQYLWDYMFWKMLGNAYGYADSNSVESTSNRLYFLDSSKIRFPDKMRVYRDKLILSKAAENDINNTLIYYQYADGTEEKIRWGKISHITDLSNGTGNWFKGGSVINALYEIISNSKHAIKSKNINVRWSGKFLVAGKSSMDDVSKIPLSKTEKSDIETNTNYGGPVTAVKSMVDIKRFVEQAVIIEQLDKSYWDDYFKIGSLYGIPREVLEASLQGATYENQEKARGAHVDYTLMPAGESLMGSFNKRFGYTTKKIVMSWDHLPFTQVFAKEKAEVDKTKVDTMITMMRAGVPMEEINQFLDTTFTFLDYEAAQRIPQQQQGNQTATT